MNLNLLCGTIRRNISQLASREAPDGFGLFLSVLAFTLIELMIVIGIIGTLASFSVVQYQKYVDRARLVVVISDIRGIEKAIDLYATDNQVLPPTLAACGSGDLRDPWGNPYQYTRLSDIPRGQWRKDRFLVPINTDYRGAWLADAGHFVPASRWRNAVKEVLG